RGANGLYTMIRRFLLRLLFERLGPERWRSSAHMEKPCRVSMSFQTSRRRFIRTAAGLLVLASALATVPIPLGFWKPAEPAAAASGPSLPNMVVWWKADSFSLSDGTAVGNTGTEWVDSSGNGFTATQATSNK